MSEWKKVRLGDIVSIKSGLSYKSEFIGKGDNLLLGMGCVSYKEQFLDSGVRPYSQDCDTKYLAAPGDLVLATRQQSDNLPILAMPAIIPEKYRGKKIIIGTNLYRVENHSDIDNRFLFFVLKGLDYVNYIRGVKTGTTVQMVSKRNVEEYRFLCPPKEAREYIVSILSRYDSLIENYQKQIKLLEEAAQRLYKEWFVDLHFPGHENTKIVDGVPEGWEKKMIGEFCDTTSGGTPSRSKTEFYTGNIPWVKTKELDDDFIFDTEEKITEEAIRKSSAKLIPSGSILMAMYGATIGKLGIATKELSCNQACCVFLLSEDNILRFYLYSWLLYNRTMLISMGKGAAQPNLSQDMIKKLEIVIPSLHLLTIFDSKVKSTYKKVYHLSSQIRLLTEARDRLLPKLMNGEIELEGGKRPERPTNS